VVRVSKYSNKVGLTSVLDRGQFVFQCKRADDGFRVSLCCSVTEQDGIFFSCFTDVIDARVANRARQSLSLQVS